MGTQTLTLIGTSQPRSLVRQSEELNDLYAFDPYYPCDGLGIEIAYRAFGSEQIRTERTNVFIIESDRDIGKTSNVSILTVETYEVTNPVFGIKRVPRIRYDFGPNVDSKGENQIIQAILIACGFAFDELSDEELSAYAKGGQEPITWLKYDKFSDYDPDFRSYIASLARDSQQFASSFSELVATNAVSEQESRLRRREKSAKAAKEVADPDLEDIVL